MTSPCPFQERFVVRILGLCTDFEISMLTHYKDMKGDENAKI